MIAVTEVQDDCFSYQQITICSDSLGFRVKYNNEESSADPNELQNIRSFRAVLEELGFSIQEAGRLVFQIINSTEFNNWLLKHLKPNEYRVCLEYIDGQCDGTYIVANDKGVFISRKAEDPHNKDKMVASIQIKQIKQVKFHGIFDIDFSERVLEILTYDGRIITGNIDEITTLVKAEFGLKDPDAFKFLLNERYDTVYGYYAVGPWFDGQQLTIATESLYNPPWKKIDKYKLPPEVSREKKIEVLKRILGTVKSFKEPQLVTWILSFGLMGNFAHYFRQKVGYFPHVIMTGRPKTGKTTLTVLNQYLYWGNNPLPPIKPKTEAQLRQLLSQSTLLIPIEEWSELANDNNQTMEMLRNLHSSAQSFVLKKVTSSNPDFNGVFLSLSSILADTNFTQDIDSESSDKVIFVVIDQDEGVDLNKAKEYHALLKFEMKNDYRLHNELHSLGIELLQIAIEKLKSLDFNKERGDLLSSIIQIGYESWIELFKKYGIDLNPTVQGFEEFPLPALKTAESETEEDLDQLFYEFVNKKRDEIFKERNTVPTSKDDLMRFGVYFEEDMVICTYGFISEFKNWMKREKGMKDRSFERLVRELNLKKTTTSIGGKTITVYKKQLYTPIIYSLSE